MAAIRLARLLEQEARGADAGEQPVLARWSSWGALPEVFDPTKSAWADEHEELRGLLTEAEWRANPTYIVATYLAGATGAR